MTTTDTTTSRPILETLTDRELYRLSFEISEVLVKRQLDRMPCPCGATIHGEPATVAQCGCTTLDNADDNYGAW